MKWWLWGMGANAIGRYYPYDKETCDSCKKPIPRTGTGPFYFEYRTLCGKCQGVRKLVFEKPPLSDWLL